MPCLTESTYTLAGSSGLTNGSSKRVTAATPCKCYLWCHVSHYWILYDNVCVAKSKQPARVTQATRARSKGGGGETAACECDLSFELLNFFVDRFLITLAESGVAQATRMMGEHDRNGSNSDEF